MSTRTIQFVEEEFYHVYNRGTDKRVIFKEPADYDRFIELLFLVNTAQSIQVREIRRDFLSIYEYERKELLVHIGAYCLMPNHFHILLTPAVEGGIQKFMLKLSTAYSMYFNKKYERTGGLFQGRFKSEHANSDEYLKYLFSYIHLNPIKLIQSDWKDTGIKDALGALRYLEAYAYSSFADYNRNEYRSAQGRNELQILNTTVFPEYFRTPEDFRREIFQWIDYKTANPSQG